MYLNVAANYWKLNVTEACCLNFSWKHVMQLLRQAAKFETESLLGQISATLLFENWYLENTVQTRHTTKPFVLYFLKHRPNNFTWWTKYMLFPCVNLEFSSVLIFNLKLYNAEGLFKQIFLYYWCQWLLVCIN